MKVTGTGIVSPLGRTPSEIATRILSAAPEEARPASNPPPHLCPLPLEGGEGRVRGKIAVAEFGAPSFRLGPFNAEDFVSIDPDRFRILDRPTSFAFVAARDAYDAAGLNRLPPDRIGISCGIGYATTGVNAAFFSDALDLGPRMVSPLLFPLTTPSAVAGALSIFLPAAGPTLTVSAGSASDLSSLARAAEMLEEGDADAVVAGAAGDADETLARALGTAGLLSGRTPLPFHPMADGTALGEGAAFVVLESAGTDSALEDKTRSLQNAGAGGQGRGAPSLGTADAVRTMGLSEDRTRSLHSAGPSAREETDALPAYLVGVGESFEHESMAGARTIARAIEDALAQSGLNPEEIDGILAGTGIRATDAAEAEAVRRVFKDRVPVISLRGIMGESFGSTNLMSALIVLECGRRGFWPASLPGPRAREALVPLTAQPTPTRGRTLLVVATSASGRAAAALFTNGMG
ncbi:MAG: hypothetical protein HYR98_02540 [Nitrospirae bacterium]|nr:hypothetical protein [Nitrospirota bacterium]